MKAGENTTLALLAVFAAANLIACKLRVPAGAIVISQCPETARSDTAQTDILDERYPPGSRVILARKGRGPSQAEILSGGLVAAGGPVVYPSGDRVLFVGKSESGPWQIYETDLSGSNPRKVTSMPGGAMDPAIINDDEIVFSSPVPVVGQTWHAQAGAAIYAQKSGASPRRLTFGKRGAIEPTVLRDGRILFVSCWSGSDSAPPALGLFTINNDGTELTPFALYHDGAPVVQRPRELPGGTMAFLASSDYGRNRAKWPETVRMARPFTSRNPLVPAGLGNCSSVEEAPEGTLLLCVKQPLESLSGINGVVQIKPGSSSPAELLFDDPQFTEIEAITLQPRPRPMGHISAVIPGRTTGTILCLNADFSRPTHDGQAGKARHVRVITTNGMVARSLGEIPLQADGSFMAEVPADTPLGFETIDEQGRILHRVEPSIWVRPGENRACLGCHEPYNRSPRNFRPLAVREPVERIGQTPPQQVQNAALK